MIYRLTLSINAAKSQLWIITQNYTNVSRIAMNAYFTLIRPPYSVICSGKTYHALWDTLSWPLGVNHSLKSTHCAMTVNNRPLGHDKKCPSNWMSLQITWMRDWVYNWKKKFVCLYYCLRKVGNLYHQSRTRII